MFDKYMKGTKHGLSGTRLNVIHRSMMTRCYNDRSRPYKWYGARGIKVCDRWLEFKNFYDDMIQGHSEELTLDRIDVNGNYEPSNCRWATLYQQHSNMRSNKFIEYKGEKVKFIDLVRSHNVPYHLAYDRFIRLGWTIEDTLSKSKQANQHGILSTES